MENNILRLSNSIQMLSRQSENPYLTEEERISLLKAELKKLETLQIKINWRVMEINNKLRVKVKEEYEDL